MRQVKWTHAFSYLAVSVLAIGLAFLISLRFLGRSLGQEPTEEPLPPPVIYPIAPDSAAAVAAEVQGFLEPFIYDGKNRRDPFQPFAEYRPVDTQSAQMLSAMQRYEVEQFKLIAIMWDIHEPKAMFLDPERQVHVAGRDESIGKRNGYIATIREGEIVVVEPSRKDGEVNFRPRVISLER
jgi:type IV pilus assembly protein PilP